MLLDLKPLFAGSTTSIPVDYSMSLTDLEFSGVRPIGKPVKISGAIVSRAGIVEADLTCEVEYQAPCDRCFAETVKTYRFRVNRTLVVSLENEDTDEMTVVPDMTLDLDEFCYPEIVLALPTKFLCKEDCKGLCPTCGQNLNEGACTCGETEIDPRLSALAELLNN